MAKIAVILGSLGTKLRAMPIAKALEEADIAVEGTKSRWEEKRKVIEETYEKLLKEVAEIENRRDRVHPSAKADRRATPLEGKDRGPET